MSTADVMTDSLAYLDDIQPPLDTSQRTVCCTDGNTVVAAGAGSGKTQVLATRFAWLVISKGIKAREILTLTFTDKASSEMYARIYSILTRLADDPAARLTAAQRKNAKEAVADFSNTHIQTLDSYCSYIVHQAANCYGIRPDFSVGSTDSDRSIKDLAFRFVLAHRDDYAVQAITEPGRLQDTADSVFALAVEKYTSLVSAPSFFSDKLETQRRTVADAWNRYMDAPASGEEEEILSFGVLKDRLMQQYGDLESTKQTQAFPSAVKNMLPELPETFQITPEQIADGSVLQQAAAFISALHTCTAPVRLPGGKCSYPEFKESFVRLRDETSAVIAALAQYIVQYRNVSRICMLLDEFLCIVNKSKRQTGSLSFYDVTELALRILEERPEIRMQEQKAYKRIMIDEFQDNNRKNGRLIELLGCPAFYVGDEKQSIYKFRGAEVSVFNELRERMKSGNGTTLSMVYNYRSSPALLAAFNQIFGGYRKGAKIDTSEDLAADPQLWIFPASLRGNGDTYKACFTEETLARKFDTEKRCTADEPELTAGTVPVHVCMLNEAYQKLQNTAGDMMDTKNRLSYFIAQKIRELAERGIRYSDIAVLDRSRTDRTYLEKYLSRLQIPYTVDQHKDLFAEAPVNDIYDFIRLCVYPFDVSAFAAVLRSPFCRLSEQSMETVLAVLQASDFIPFNSSFDDEIRSQLDADQYGLYQAAAELYASCAHDVLCQPLTDTVTRLWYDTGYRYELLWNRTAALYAEQYDLLFELARRTDSDGKSAAWFVDQLARQKTHGSFSGASAGDMDTADVDYPLEESCAVKILSVHKSKGLEFPYVFIYGCTGSAKPEVNRDKIYYSAADGLSLKFRSGEANYFFMKQQNDENAKNDAEYRRLIYVAMTRAREEVFITGSWNRPLSENSKARPSLMETVIGGYYPDVSSDPEYALNSTVFTPGAPFDFFSIPPVLKAEGYGEKILGESAGADARKKCISRMQPLYQQAETVAVPAVKKNRVSPSSMEQKQDSTVPCPEAGYPEVNHVIEKTKYQVKAVPGTDEPAFAYDFSYADFGILAHAYMEANANGIPPETFAPPEKFFSKLSAENSGIVKNACIRMVHTFNESAAGKDFAECRAAQKDCYHAEYAFCSYFAGTFISGQIDLIYRKKDGSCAIIDYKTDQSLDADTYSRQLALYRKAAAAMTGTDERRISCILYFLRFGTAADITDKVDAVTDEQLAEEIQSI